ncbi:TerB family tellurite resistance protein (plasmid) [Hymenobacter sp. 5317J-9]|uniref:TerB family tellurite resistance protein n=1 Tax=Hymenobacter sp. 5317J-9 TaxID=2932250 RepID=UPI001FD6E7E8|nr:TerB family tellurite resistance protein [Hymenobacter sp. 5317J-9]UOR00219.1 TerB family tellurite resistance protein [Hymenobacter sp. 5317J-9]
MDDTRLLESYSAEEKMAYLSAIASLATADRQASAAETEFLQALVHLAGLEGEAGQQVLAAAQDATNQSIQRDLDVLKTSDLRFPLVADLISFARADGEYADGEEAMIGKMAQYLGISQQQKQTLETVVDQAATVPHDPQDLAKRGFFDRIGDMLSSMGIPKSALMTGMLGVVAPVAISRVMSGGNNQGRGSLLGGRGGGSLGGLLGGAAYSGLGSMLGGMLGGTGGGNGVQGSMLGGLPGGSLGGSMGGGGGGPQPVHATDEPRLMAYDVRGLSDRSGSTVLVRGEKIFHSEFVKNAPLLDLLKAGSSVPASIWDEIHHGVRGPDGNGNQSSEGSEALDSTQTTASEPEENRQLLVETQEQVRPTEPFALTVQVVTEALAAGPGAGVAAFPAGFVGQVDLDVKAPGLHLMSPSFQQLDVPARGDSDRVRFLLRAAVAGTYRIRVDAWNGAAYLTSVEVIVKAEAAQAETSALPLLPPHSPQPVAEPLPLPARARRARPWVGVPRSPTSTR